MLQLEKTETHEIHAVKLERKTTWLPSSDFEFKTT